MSSRSADSTDIPKRLKLNARQWSSETNYKSFQGLKIGEPIRTTRFDSRAPPDPVPMPNPGRQNQDCLYNMNDITIKYHLEKDVWRPSARHVLDGHIVESLCPLNVQWKWLLFYNNKMRFNNLFRYFSCPYGCFEIKNHKLNRMYLPERDVRGIFAADFTCTIKVRGNWFNTVDIDDPNIIDDRLDDYNNGATLPYQFRKFNTRSPPGMANMNFEHIKDTWRYCFAFDYILGPNDKKTALDGRQFLCARDMWIYCIENIFELFVDTLASDFFNSHRRTRFNRNDRFYWAEQYDEFYNFILYKDVPKKEYMKTFKFKEGHFDDEHPNENVVVFNKRNHF